ncbi:hypothetical protein [Nonomuraea cavernae]|uniref:DUF4386 domain-containing protein n=1 Tax=Nonomuraea cavernae TaxID=2045107 RepID=A0A917Z4J1_9ACTN|nr:hypothetical protein [Nonomuraea cavernae]MCA2188126.1 hypothetical protein [Nonomuraea cavernae]GGO72869.1 hypothetical protein GCM10012289_41980 [Nonomuraea cavernae]
MLNNSVRFRRVATGSLLIVAPALQLIAVIVDPGTWGDDREAVSFGDNPALAQLQSVLYHWSWVLTAIAAFGLLHLVRRKAVVLGHIAGTMTIVGYINLSALLLTDPVEWWFGRRYPAEEAQRLAGEVLDLPGVIFGFTLPWTFFALLGLPLLMIAVWRAGAAHWWIPLTVTLGGLAAQFVPYGPLMVPLWALPALALGALGVRVLRMSDDDWMAYYPVPAPRAATAGSSA